LLPSASRPKFCLRPTSLNRDVIFNFWITYFRKREGRRPNGHIAFYFVKEFIRRGVGAYAQIVFFAEKEIYLS